MMLALFIHSWEDIQSGHTENPKVVVAKYLCIRYVVG